MHLKIWYNKRMENNQETLKQQIGKNISEYRKLSNLSQLEFAEKLNYSDKAISKWERGESLPDIIVIKQIADLFGITVNDLIGTKDTKKKKLDLKKIIQNKKLVLLLSVGLVWLVSTIAFVFLQLFNVLPQYNWLLFIYALPISSIICIIFFTIWKQLFYLTISESVLIWTTALSLCLSIPYPRIWLMAIIAIPLQILTLLWNWFLYKKQKNS